MSKKQDMHKDEVAIVGELALLAQDFQLALEREIFFRINMILI